MRPFEYAETFFLRRELPFGFRLHRHGTWPDGVEHNTPTLAIELVSKSLGFWDRLRNACTGLELACIDYDGTIYAAKDIPAKLRKLLQAYAENHKAFYGKGLPAFKPLQR